MVAVLSRRSIVSYAAGGEAERLAVGVYAADATAEGQVPAASGIVLHTTPVVAE